MQEIQTASIPIPWPNTTVTVAWGPVPASSLMPIDWQRSLARFSLKAGSDVLGHTLPLNGKGMPTVFDHKKIKGMSELTCSLAHTSGPMKSKNLAVGASLLAPNFMASGVGIDLEWSQRPMREGAYRRFRHEGDHASWGQMSELLWTWMVKEACFKAASNTWGDAITLINQIRLMHPFQAEGLAEAYNSSGVCMGEVNYGMKKINCLSHALNITVALIYKS